MHTSLTGLVCLAVISALTLARSAGGPDELFVGIGLASVALLFVERENIPPNLRRAGALLTTGSAVLLPLASDPVHALSRGVFVGGLLISLTGAVTLIGRCAYRSPEVRSLGVLLRSQPVRRRYLAFTVASQMFSALLSLAGANLLFIMASGQGDEGREGVAPIVSAITRGFSAAIFWSPMFGNMALLLALYPSLTWLEVFPMGLLMAQITVLVGVLMQGRDRKPEAQMSRHIAPSSFSSSFVPMVVAVVLFFGAVVAVSLGLDLAVSAAIVLCAAPVAFLLNVLMASGRGRLRQGGAWLASDLRNLPSLAAEVTLFLAAGCAGSIFAAVVPASFVEALASLLSGEPAVAIGALMLILLGLSLAGIHPVLTAVFLASTLTPQRLELPPMVHFCAVLGAWGLAASLTPFSVLSMSASRYSGLDVYRVSVGENWRFASVCTLLAISVLAAVAGLS